MEINRCSALVINAPEFFKDPDFQLWLNSGEPKLTWHQGGAPTEWSDTVVMVDAGLTGEGPDSDMPEHIWQQIVEACRNEFPAEPAHHIMVRLTNVG